MVGVAIEAAGSGPASEDQVKEKKSRSKCPGIRVVGCRIYDSQNGKTCHQSLGDSTYRNRGLSPQQEDNKIEERDKTILRRKRFRRVRMQSRVKERKKLDRIKNLPWSTPSRSCRQKTMDFAAICTIQKGDKACPIRFCHKCLLNRYGENAEEVALLGNWKCPKCRDICNCSVCMKKKGHKPTGMLVHTAKENGFSSVSELLRVKGPENFVHNKVDKVLGASPKKQVPLKDPAVACGGKLGKENCIDGSIELKLRSSESTPILNKKSKKPKREGLKEVSNGNGGGDANLEGSGQKKLRKTEKLAENEVKLDESMKIEKVKDVIVNKKKSKINSNEVCKEAAKTNGNSANGLLENKCPKVEAEEISNKKIKKKRKITAMDSHEILDGADGKGRQIFDIRNDNCHTDTETAIQMSKNCKDKAEFWKKQKVDDCQLPLGACLTTIAGIDLPPEDVGHVLQFLEFCAGFGKVLDMKKGQPEAVIREIINGRRGRRSHYSCVAQMYIQLLSLIQKDHEEESPVSSPTNGPNLWFQVLGTYVSKCLLISKDIPCDCFDRGNEGYDRLTSLQKLKLLNFLCDEALNTKKLRSWIDDQNSKALESKKDAKEKLVAAKDKERSLKQKIQDDLAKAIIAKNGVPLTVSEHEAIFSQIKSEAAQAHAEMLEAKGAVSEKIRRPDAVRTDSVLLDVDGRALWRLNCYNSQSDILLQDLGTWNAVPSTEKWFVYDTEQKEEIERYISSLRTKRLRAGKIAELCKLADAPSPGGLQDRSC